MAETEKSISNPHDRDTLSSSIEVNGPQSLGNQATYAGAGQRTDNESLGDQPTLGGLGEALETAVGSDMEIVDLAARYKIEGVIGKGGMGEVLLAIDTRLNRKVAIKRILGSAAKNPTAVSRFLTEAQSIAALNHPNIVQIYDYGREKDGPFLIMEFVEGSNLLDQCQAGAMALEEAVELACQLCDGLAKAHAAGIIHRDIKPANVLLTRDGVPKLTDFGLAKVETGDTGMTMAGAVLGTLDFMPPEQRRDAALTDARSDLWSLAATLYQMVTGKSPRIIRLNDVPKALQDVLGKALEDSKDDRYPSIREFRDALRASQSSRSPQLPEQMEQLGAGECSKCHARNEAHRKFCRECASPLRCTCLKCEAEIPVWDKVCPECGGRQADLIASRLSTIQQQLHEAEQLRSQSQYQAAITIAGETLLITDQRLSLHRSWAEEFIKSTEAEWDSAQASAHQHFEEAQRHLEAFDHDAAIRTLHTIPEPLRSANVITLLQRLESELSELNDLLQTIANRIKQKDTDGLLVQVDRAIELKGARADLLKLREQLWEHECYASQRDEAFGRARKLLAEGKAREALSAISMVRSATLPDQEELANQLERIVSAEAELTNLVKDAKADGVIDAEDVVTLLPKIFDYLELNPNHENVLKLRDSVVSRLSSLSSEHVLQIPARTIRKIPLEVLCRLSADILSQFPNDIRDKFFFENSIGISLRFLPPGQFKMGKGSDAHEVTLTKPFHLGVHEVTQEQYEKVMGTNPSHFKGLQNPVEQVSWDDAVEFCRRLSAMPAEKAAGRIYRLPTEAEWEYACRAGTTTTYSFGDDESQFSDYGWFNGNSGRMPHPVGQKKSNAWGLYDMHGNVWEWCSDWWGDYPTGKVTDPLGPSEGSSRVRRGGSWFLNAGVCRSAYRFSNTPDSRYFNLGFRVAVGR